MLRKDTSTKLSRVTTYRLPNVNANVQELEEARALQREIRNYLEGDASMMIYKDG